MREKKNKVREKENEIKKMCWMWILKWSSKSGKKYIMCEKLKLEFKIEERGETNM
jgi:hypothetical protein